jgi:hypothetical protein
MKKITIGLLALTLCLVAMPVLGADLPGTVTRGLTNVQTQVGWGTVDLEAAIIKIITFIMAFLGLIAIIIILWGGFTWMTAGGNEEKIASAKKILIAGVVGLAIILAAYAIATFVVNILVNATT